MLILRDRLALENLRPLYEGIVDLHRLILQELLKPVSNDAQERPSGKPASEEKAIKEAQAQLFGTTALETRVREMVSRLIESAYDAEHKLLWQSPIFSLC